MEQREFRNTSKDFDKPRHSKGDIVSQEKMLEAGVYYGHRKSQWHPAMKPYIAGVKKDTHVISTQKTKRALEFAYDLINRFVSKGADVIFVGTKKQAKQTIKDNALRTNSHYVSERWLGGTLTNNRTIYSRVKRMFELEKMQANDFAGYTKKEGVEFTKELEKLQKNLSGIKNMRRRPSIMIVADPKGDIIAVKEAKKLGIKVFGIVDTNVDPTIVDVAIPANDDSVRSIALIMTILADAIAKAKKGVELYAYKSDDQIVLPEELKRERKPFKRNNQRTFNRNFNNSRNGQRSETNKPKVETPKKVTKEEKVESPKQDLDSLKVADLREMAKTKEIKGFSTMKKAELVEALS